MDLSKIKVIIIEDERLVSKMLKDFLEDYGFSVMTAENGKEGLKLISEENFSAAIVDMRLPDMDGEKVIMEAHNIKPGVKYFVHTGSLDFELSERLLSIGMNKDMVLHKPMVDMGEICRTLIEHIEKS